MTCRLFPNPKSQKDYPVKEEWEEKRTVRESPIDWIIDLVKKVFDTHEPLMGEGIFFSAFFVVFLMIV